LIKGGKREQERECEPNIKQNRSGESLSAATSQKTVFVAVIYH